MFSEKIFPCLFVPQVEALHDFEAASSDELNLKRGDTVLVIPSAAADQVIAKDLSFAIH